MIFLIEYDRNEGRIVAIKSFREKEEAEDSRIKLELNLNVNNSDHEVVLLEAANEQALRRTHRRYFENLADLVSEPVHQ